MMGPRGKFQHVIARSEATGQSASPAAAQAKRNYSRRIRRSCGFALGITNLPSFSAGKRIAAPVCALVRNDMQKTGACQRMQVGGHEEKCVDGSGFTWYNVLAYADTQQVSACHCEERSDVAIRTPCSSTKRKAILKANTEKCYGFALGIANLLGFPAGTRIAAPVCALVRNDMQKTEALLRLQGCVSQ